MRLLFLFLLCAPTLYGADPIFPDIRRNPDIPDMKKVIGYDFGSGISMHYEATAYAQRLASASPCVSIRFHGRTWESRRLMLVFVTSERNQKRLRQLEETYKTLADPRITSTEQLAELNQDLPALVWLSQSVHGDEPSGTDSGLYLAWHLASAQDDPSARNILDKTVVVIELMQNPDGRDRFVSEFRQNASLQPNPDPRAIEHHQSWPSGRYNHYLFDLNRDWFLVSQPETRSRIKGMLSWYPQIVVDLHEMGSNRSFFAAAPAPPYNPFLPAGMFDGYRGLGRAVGAAFDANGLDYFHTEIFDGLYPGYGESWPSLHGALGVLFEQGSANGLVRRLPDGEELTHSQAVARQTLASLAVLAHAAADPAKIITDFHGFRRYPMDNVQRARQAFLLPGGDPARMMLLGGLLAAQGVEVEQLGQQVRGVPVSKKAGASTRKRDLPAGTLLVRLDQPAGMLARTLLVDELKMEPSFLKQQDALRGEHRSPQLYDLTAWSLPRLFGVPIFFSGGAVFKQVGVQPAVIPQLINPKSKLAFLIQPNIHQGSLLGELQRAGIRVSFTKQLIRHSGMDFPPGSLIVRISNNPETLVDSLRKLGEAYGLTILGTNSAWFEEGPSFGSNMIKSIPQIKAAMPWGKPAKAESAGWMRYTFDHLLKHQITAVEPELFRKGSIHDFNVIALPDGDAEAWRETLGKAGLEKLTGWVREGGVLIAVGRTVDLLAHKDTALLATAREWRDGVVRSDEVPPHPKQVSEDAEKMIKPKLVRPDKAHGAIVDVVFDANHWLSYGMNERQSVLFNSNRIYRPLRLDSGRNPGRYAAAKELDPAGYIPAETLKQLADKAYVMIQKHGDGLVIAFTEDPNFRAMQKGVLPLMSNAVYLGAAHAVSKQ